ncbi:hypothetical protein [Mammaliicoccus sp. Dog046]|uniref:hypothetical protein n=1 Tax=Mammaliicoccus sp. Dog046 TaxID=3034233 RepID=UPI002B25E4C1|nr:hypothetical protein [Mammaliicoccus sp. Dog046]WQK86184.1 hypothetical protein P3U32_03870 [Mammaliicoccus sp. Dog046]
MGKRFIKYYLMIGMFCIILSIFFDDTPKFLLIGAGLGFFLTALLAKLEKEDKVDEQPDENTNEKDKKSLGHK